jgi:hypothetical protein
MAQRGNLDDGKRILMRNHILIAILTLTACSAPEDTSLAEQAVPKFHEQLDAGEFARIYEHSADDLRRSATQQQFIAVLDAIHRKLGTTKTTSPLGWRIDYQTSGTFVTLTYDTDYSDGKAQERFVYRLQDHKALLVSYYINSNALILR